MFLQTDNAHPSNYCACRHIPKYRILIKNNSQTLSSSAVFPDGTALSCGGRYESFWGFGLFILIQSALRFVPVGSPFSGPVM
jgi:hypothetical protein